MCMLLSAKITGFFYKHVPLSGRVAARNVDHKLQSVYRIGIEELGRVTAEEWTKAIQLASKQEALYAEIDGLQLDHPSVPLPEVQGPAPIIQEPPVDSNEFVIQINNLQKCSNCTFETKVPGVLKKHLNSIRHCSKCSKTFCGVHAKRQHARHEKKHEVKPKKEHICSFCKKIFPFASTLKTHRIRTVCG